MNYEKYDTQVSDNFLQFKFFSEGPKGRIAKRVLYQSFENNTHVYNLSFGDINHKNEIDDLVVTDNGDSDKILATVAQTAAEVLETYPDKWIFITGSTPARTRLYRMGIAKNLDEFQTKFEIFGIINKSVVPFNKEGTYDAYLVRKK